MIPLADTVCLSCSSSHAVVQDSWNLLDVGSYICVLIWACGPGQLDSIWDDRSMNSDGPDFTYSSNLSLNVTYTSYLSSVGDFRNEMGRISLSISLVIMSIYMLRYLSILELLGHLVVMVMKMCQDMLKVFVV
jgi:hypothetical protein